MIIAPTAAINGRNNKMQTQAGGFGASSIATLMNSEENVSFDNTAKKEKPVAVETEEVVEVKVENQFDKIVTGRELDPIDEENRASTVEE